MTKKHTKIQIKPFVHVRLVSAASEYEESPGAYASRVLADHFRILDAAKPIPPTTKEKPKPAAKPNMSPQDKAYEELNQHMRYVRHKGWWQPADRIPMQAVSDKFFQSLNKTTLDELEELDELSYWPARLADDFFIVQDTAERYFEVRVLQRADEPKPKSSVRSDWGEDD
jgi:hypothetical protein